MSSRLPAATNQSEQSFSDPANPTPNPALISDDARIDFWAAQASRLDWAEPWHTTHRFEKPQVIGEDQDGNPTYSVPEIAWFEGGKLNVAHNCVDRHVEAGRGDHVALYFEGEPGDRLVYTYADLQREVARASHALTDLGVVKGDRVVIYLPVIPETVIMTLACARIGAIHSLVFGGFSAEALKFRVEDTGAKVLVTTDGQNRRGKVVPVKVNADEACSGDNQIEHVVVVRRTSRPGNKQLAAGTRGARSNDELEVPWTPGRDVWWHDLIKDAPTVHTPEFFDAETPLFIIYTSGTTGRPKGLVHTMGGYLVQTAYTHALLFDLLPDTLDDDGALRPDELSMVNDPAKVDSTVHWCTADLAWVTAHTYEIYGPLVNGVSEVIYEGTPNTPHPGRHFEVIERYGVTNYYTAPTLIRSLMGAFPHGIPQIYNFSSVRLLGSVGESINPEAWRWLRSQIGRDQVPFVDTWWQSETGSCVASPRPHDPQFAPPGTFAAGTPGTSPKPGCATRAIPGVSVRVLDESGEPVETGHQGLAVVDKIGPSMARTVWGDPQRYLSSYWQQYGERGWFLAGDGARLDDDDDLYILGRVDDVINVSGHRLSTIEIESALVTHPLVVEAGTTPVEDPLTGHAVLACVVLTPAGAEVSATQLHDELCAHVTREIGPIAKPREVIAVPDLPKTRSGKITRRLLAQLYHNQPLGDRSSLQNEEALDAIADVMSARRS
ncbi:MULTISPECIES: AMP-binding protein [Kocuria]|uniref:acetate--CoA ligase n=1 Tax=Kocuria subflava TaxID=1736139 RepID=A0A846TXB8_9MICC|nr:MULTISPECIES: AMP-binding protein [Kocuria]NKE10392.1 AMP-binding protein [Kocuria subflava]